MVKFEELPDDTKNVVRRLVDRGCIIENNGLIEITIEMAKLLLILDRADVF